MRGLAFQGRDGQPMNRYFRILAMILSALPLACFIPTGIASGSDYQEIERLVDEFQSQVPWFRTPGIRDSSREGQPQPPSYLSEDQEEASQAELSYSGPSICFDPFARRYYYCFPDDPVIYEPFPYPHHYYFGWNPLMNCPPGYFWRPGKGCLRD